MTTRFNNSLQIARIGIATNVLTVEARGWDFFKYPLAVGSQVTFQNVATNTFLNGATVTLTALTVPNSSSPQAGGALHTLTAAFTHGDVTIAADSGDVFVLNPSPDPGPKPLDSTFPRWVKLDSEYKSNLPQLVTRSGQ